MEAVTFKKTVAGVICTPMPLLLTTQRLRILQGTEEEL